MELKDFVKSAISDIVEGVRSARSDLGSSVAIGTTSHSTVSQLPTSVVQDSTGKLYSVVSFDVAVTTADTTEGGGGIQIAPFKLGATVSGSSETVSRIQFALTLSLK